MNSVTIRRLVLDLGKPFFRWAASVHIPFTKKLMTGVQYYQLYPHLKPGTIFTTHISGELTTLLIPGFWSHAAIYTPLVGKVPDEIVSEAEKPGVLATDLITFTTTKDYLLVIEPSIDLSVKYKVMARAAEIAAAQHGKPYDYDFLGISSNQKAFYCSELVWYAYDKACKEFGVACPFSPRITLGVPTVTPSDIANDKQNFVVVWDSRKVTRRTLWQTFKKLLATSS